MYEGHIVSGGCPFTGTESLTQVVLTTSYEIMGLEEDSSYLITVTASNLAGSSEGTATAMTLEAGERLIIILPLKSIAIILLYSSICSSHFCECI